MHNLQSVSASLSALTKLSTTPNLKTLDATANNQRYFPYFSNTDFQERENLAQFTSYTKDTSTNYTYDNYGNATTVSTIVTDKDPNSPYYTDTWTSTIVNTFSPNTSTWCLNLPTATTITNSSSAPNGMAITRSVGYNSPDYTNCRETEKVIEPNNATYKVVEHYTYDTAFGNFGNLHSSTVTGAGMSPRTTTVTWTTNGQFPLTISDPLSESITLGFDPITGMKSSQTDPNSMTSNPLNTTWTYDKFGRQLTELRMDGTSTNISYEACATNGCVNANNKMTVTTKILNVGGTTRTIEHVYVDSLDRPLVTSQLMLNGAYDRKEMQYDDEGNVQVVVAPCTFVGCVTLCHHKYLRCTSSAYRVATPS